MARNTGSCSSRGACLAADASLWEVDDDGQGLCSFLPR